MKYKYFIFSDTHGCYDELMDSLHKAGFQINNKAHILIGAGDYFDRGSQSANIYAFLFSDKLKNRVYLIRGNHDDMFLDFLSGKDNGYFNCVYNGLANTIESFSNLKVNLSMLLYSPEFYTQEIIACNPHLIDWLTSMKKGFQIDNYIITHAGLTNVNAAEADKPAEWCIDNWALTPEFVKKYKPDNHTHIVGHWHARQLRDEFNQKASDETFIYDKFIGIDACTNSSGFVNIYVIESENLPAVLNKY